MLLSMTLAVEALNRTAMLPCRRVLRRNFVTRGFMFWERMCLVALTTAMLSFCTWYEVVTLKLTKLVLTIVMVRLRRDVVVKVLCSVIVLLSACRQRMFGLPVLVTLSCWGSILAVSVSLLNGRACLDVTLRSVLLVWVVMMWLFAMMPTSRLWHNLGS